ncbi:MAG: hypothetical protein R3280_06975 [Marinobacter sp.]|uniref:hypothetical protein n=1 Tax=Marinobacter sp. TaxID=50741 RepID=UPI00299D3F22|nr:hypothetical protein [Marinobacter sp.]MDX1634358.1 hypothetical protein [Marinobacter sp.]
MTNRRRHNHRLRANGTAGAALALAMGLASGTVAADEWQFSGTATSLEGEVLYDSRHQVVGECRQGLWHPTDHEVTYTESGDESPFATKSLTYLHSALRPSFEFRQPRFDEVMEVENVNDERLLIDWQTNEGGTENYRVPIEGLVVVDAGFDNLVRENWQTLLAGESVDFQFLAPTRGENYDFVLEPAEDDRITAPHVFRIRPTGFVLGFLVDPILLGYDDEGALTDYLGLTNVRKDRDNNYTAHVRYRHENTPDCALVR